MSTGQFSQILARTRERILDHVGHPHRRIEWPLQAQVPVAHPLQLLLLDEPTNHLSPALCDELEDALGHDRRLRPRWRGGELRVHKGRTEGRRRALYT